VGTYLRGLVGAMSEETGGDELVLFHQEGAPPPESWTRNPRVRAAALTRPRRGTTLWDQVSWPSTLAREGIQVFHSPFWTLPVFAASRSALVQTIHDLTPIKIRASVSFKNEMIFRFNFACARFADRVIVPSRATFGDVVTLARIPSSRVRVVPEGIDLPPDLLVRAEAILPSLRERLGLSGRYLLHTGGQDRIKNLGAAVEAVALLLARGFDVRLVVTGESGAATQAMRSAAEAAGIGVRLVGTGFVGREELIALYRGAAALLYPSRNEGFGLPVLEAMACGTPVVAARAGALPDVGGGACLYADPDDAAGLSAAAGSILNDDALARRLSEAGKARAAGFTWADAARRTLDVYHEAGSR
jgi:glycosyltransferase involved in cell wall biosynthesis